MLSRNCWHNDRLSSTRPTAQPEYVPLNKVFHRDTAKFDKEIIIAEFQQLADRSSVRVILATEALGLGVNLPDVRRVVLYSVPLISQVAGRDLGTFSMFRQLE